jgi:hypothetical protein
MGTRNSVRTNSRASLTIAANSKARFLLSRGNMNFSKKSDDEMRPISVDFRQVRSPYFSQGRMVGVDIGVVSFKRRTFKRATIPLMSRQMAS